MFLVLSVVVLGYGWKRLDFDIFLYLAKQLSKSIYTMPRTITDTPFKVPTKAKIKETRLESDEHDVSVSTGIGHRKDNSEWDKRMERQLAQIERRKESEQNISKKKTRQSAIPKRKLLSERGRG